MASLSLTTLPTEFNEGIYSKAMQSSALAKITSARPQLFANQAYHVLTAPPKAQFVGAGQAKAGSNPQLKTITVAPLKAQVTMRFDEEVKWADEDHQMGVLQELADQGGLALARALDLGAIHGVSPLEGTRFGAIQNPAIESPNKVELVAGRGDDAFRAAYALMLDNGGASSVVMDPRFSFDLASQVDAHGHPLHPELGFGQNVTSYMGLPTGVSNTVSGVAELPADSKLRALLLADGVFAWGVQKNLGLRMFDSGNPDNLMNNGVPQDLAGHNQIALRLEIVYSFAFIDLNGVVQIVDALA